MEKEKYRRLWDGAAPEIIRWALICVFTAGGIFIGVRITYTNMTSEIDQLKSESRVNIAEHTDFKVLLAKQDQKLEDILDYVKRIDGRVNRR